MADGVSGGAAAERDGHAANAVTSDGRTPVALILDEETSIRHFLSLILQGVGIDTEEFADRSCMAEAVAKRTPELVFVNVGLDTGEAIKAVLMLAEHGYSGYIQLMSSRGAAVLEHVRNAINAQQLRMLPVLKKPFDAASIVRLVQTLKLGHPAPVAARVDLGEVLSKGWIELWYQPKIDLRKKQLAGVEAFARARHPQFGILSPGAFLPDATEADLISLSELALKSALTAAASFAKVGINLRFAVNVPLNALTKLAVADIVRAYRPPIETWAGLIIDVTEAQVVAELALVTEVAKQLAPHDVSLAVDRCGRAYSSLTGLKEAPFAEFKLDQGFVTDCATDKVNAPLCKTIIDLAHSYASVAVAIGIEKASDALALTSMGCDLGQGFLLGQPMPEERLMSLLRQRVGQRRSAVAT